MSFPVLSLEQGSAPGGLVELEARIDAVENTAKVSGERVRSTLTAVELSHDVALQQAVAAASLSGSKCLLFDAATEYRLSGGLQPLSGWTYKSTGAPARDGIGSATLRRVASATGQWGRLVSAVGVSVLTDPTANSMLVSCRFVDLRFHGGDQAHDMVDLFACAQFRFERCMWIGCVGARWVHARELFDSRFIDCRFEWGGSVDGVTPGVDLASGILSIPPHEYTYEYTNQIHFTSCVWESYVGCALATSGNNTNELYFTDCKAESHQSGVSHFRFANCVGVNFGLLQVTARGTSGNAAVSIVDLVSARAVTGQIHAETVAGGQSWTSALRVQDCRHVDVSVEDYGTVWSTGYSITHDGLNGSSVKLRSSGGVQVVAGSPIGRSLLDEYRLVTFGDSRLNNAWATLADPQIPVSSQWNFLPICKQMMQGRLRHDPRDCFATEGYRSDQWANNDNLVKALDTDAAWAVFFGVVNDAAQSTNDATDYFSAYVAPFVRKWLRAGRKAILFLDPGANNLHGNIAKVASFVRYNRQVREFASRNSGVYVFDYPAVVLTNAGVRLAGFSNDGTHDNLMPGVTNLAYQFSLFLNGLLPALRVPPFVTTTDEVFANGQEFLFDNGLMLNTQTSSAWPVTGTFPAGVTNLFATNVTGTAAVTAIPNSGRGNELVLTLTASAPGDCRIQIDLPAREASGDVVRAVAEAYADPSSWGLAALGLAFEQNRGGASFSAMGPAPEWGAGMSAAYYGKTLMLDTGAMTIKPGARGWLTLYLTAVFGSAGTSTIRFRRITAVKGVAL